MTTIVFAFPYHDPHGLNNELFRKTLPMLQSLFSEICIGATPSTVTKNEDFLTFLESEGCKITKNTLETNVGDHYRSALRLGVESTNAEHIFFGYLDRVLFALNTNHKQEFIADIEAAAKRDITLFERSEKAWSSHPTNYREIEQALNTMGKYVVGEEVELGNCGMCMCSELAMRMLQNSTAPSFSAGTEWILLAYQWRYAPFRTTSDWLVWEDPFIENRNEEELKLERERNPKEVLKRLEMNGSFLDLLREERFHNLLQ